MSLTYKTGKELQNLSKKDLNDLTELLNFHWGSFTTATAELVKERFSSDEFFLVGYESGSVVSLLETILIKNNLIEIPFPAVYDKLTNKGTWQSLPYREGKHDILVLVDISAKGKGNGAETLKFAKSYLAKETKINHVLTYTPVINKVQQWHLKNGARLTNNWVINARLGYQPRRNIDSYDDYPEDVLALSYSTEIKRLREKS